MKKETLEAIQFFIEETYNAISTVASLGIGADLSVLRKAKNDLWDALQNETIEQADR